MKNLFFYKRREPIAPTENSKKTDELQFNTFEDFFNVDTVIRGMTLEDGRVLLILNDIHERVEEVPKLNAKKTHQIGTKVQRRTVQSEIYLDKEDGARFFDKYKTND